MEQVTRTVYGAAVQSSLFLGVACQYPEFSTLNKALNIRANQPPSNTARPSLSFYVWGNRGHKISVGANGIPLNEIVQHRATDAGLYGMLPFVLREVNNDLTASERTKYCLRRQEEHNGVLYYAYYGRRLNKSNLVPAMYYTQVEDGESTTTNFIPTAANLTPTPPSVSNTGTNLITADYVSARSRMALEISENEVAEMLNVAKVLFDDERYAIISEIGLVTSVDLAVTAPGFGGATFNFLETIGAQIAAHVATYQALVYTNTGTTIEMDVGVNEPLFSLSPTDGSLILGTNGLTSP